MRFTIAAVAGLVAVASAATSSAAAAASTVSMDPAQASALKCLDACDPGDVTCQSYCITVPSPNDAQANATNTCVSKCPQGKGSEADTAKYSSCVQDCIANNYWKTVDGTPRTTGGSGSGSGSSKATGSGSDSTASATAGASGADSTDASNTGSDSSSSGTATGSSSSSTSSDSAAGAIFVGSASLAGLLAAVLAL